MQDQIAMLKAGCTEIMFLKANYTYDIEKKALTLGPDILYTRDSFLQGKAVVFLFLLSPIVIHEYCEIFAT